MNDDIAAWLAQAIKQIFGIECSPVVTRPEPQFGDAASNVAMQLTKELQQPPREIAEQVAAKLRENKQITEVSVAGPGFINLRLSDVSVAAALNQTDTFEKTMADQEVVVEYLDPNPFKEVHIGHAYSGTIGDAIAHLLEQAGANVHRVTYQGDVGLHVAKALYAILGRIGNDPEKLAEIPEAERVRFLGEAYAEGATAYEQDDQAKQAIDELNKTIYELSDETVKAVYATGRAWSLQYFDDVYQTLDFTPFEKNYMERESAVEGLKTVHDHLADGTFETSDGAIIFRGEKHGLHTRVFVNSRGLPTYDAKDLGLAPLKWRDYHYDASVIITANEQSNYFEVMFKALEQFAPELAGRTRHIAHGFVTLPTGKMSSRTGRVLRAVDVFEQVKAAVRALSPEASDETVRLVALAALKYSFLKNRIGGNIAFDIGESVSIEGNSGPYLQYAHARARSILSKKGEVAKIDLAEIRFDEHERALALKLVEYPEVLQRAVSELMPHHICTYLYELAQTFNRFYEKSRVLGDEREALRLQLVQRYAGTLRTGLGVLGIPAPDYL